MNQSRKMIILSAPSGSGKTTLVQHLLRQYPSFSLSISCTTRSPRRNEENGVDYYFLSNEEFVTKINNHEFAEYEEVYQGLYYGTLKSEIQRVWDMDKHIIFDIDVKGALSLKKLYPDNSLSLFIKVPSIESLKSRLSKRGLDSSSKIEERINKAEEELGYSKYFDKILLNDDLNTAKTSLIEIITQFISSR